MRDCIRNAYPRIWIETSDNFNNNVDRLRSASCWFSVENNFNCRNNIVPLSVQIVHYVSLHPCQKRFFQVFIHMRRYEYKTNDRASFIDEYCRLVVVDLSFLALTAGWARTLTRATRAGYHAVSIVKFNPALSANLDPAAFLVRR